MLRCILCGKPAPAEELAALKKLGAHPDEVDATKKGPIYICPTCGGRARYEAELQGKGLHHPPKTP